MPACIYCETAFDQASPAHVVPEGIGGRITSRTTVCDNCNNSFSEMEGDICLRIAPMGALNGARRGDNTPVTARVEHNGKLYLVEDGTMYELAGPPLERGRSWPMPARREDQVARAAEALRSRGLEAEAMLDGRFVRAPDPSARAVTLDEQSEPVPLTMEWRDPAWSRVMVKMSLELLAAVDPTLARSSALRDARRFARYGEGSFACLVDTETSGARVGRVEATFLHGVEVWTFGARVYYRCTLFSHLHFVGTLSSSWTGAPFAIGYTFDMKDSARHVRAREERDGSVLVNKSGYVRNRELADALDDVEAKSLANSARRVTRAEAVDFSELYPEVAARLARRRARKKPTGD